MTRAEQLILSLEVANAALTQRIADLEAALAERTAERDHARDWAVEASCHPAWETNRGTR